MFRTVVTIRRGGSDSSSRNFKRTTARYFLKNYSASSILKLPPTGLFGNPSLRSPQSFLRLADETVAKAENRIQQACSIGSSKPSLIVSLLDEVSDAISVTADSAEACRHLHPDDDFIEAANDAYNRVTIFMHSLNSNSDLFPIVKKIKDSPELFGTLTEEEKIIITQVVDDSIIQGGVHLSSSERERVVAQQCKVGLLAAQFLSAINNEQSKGNQPSADALLLPLLEARTELAQTLGFASFAHMTLCNKALKTPEAVSDFLLRVATQLKPRTEYERKLLADFKLKDKGIAIITVDEEQTHYQRIAKQTLFPVDPKLVSEYFTIDTFLNGVTIVTERLFGLKIEEIKAESSSELWYHSVRKFQLRDPNASAPLGIFYLDASKRRRKHRGYATFVIRSAHRNTVNGERQTPTVILCANADHKSLKIPDMEKLFHEFGHILACLLCDTQYQWLSGIRCPIDFVEMPSTLFENFVWDYDCLRLWARNPKTGQVLPKNLFDQMRGEKSNTSCRKSWKRRMNSIEQKRSETNDKAQELFYGLDTATQLFFSELDLRLHSTTNFTKPISDISDEIHRKYLGVPCSSSISSRFSHLYNYPASYYSYPYCEMLSSSVWNALFASDPLSRLAGERYRTEILRFGGARESATLMKNILGRSASVDDFITHLASVK